MHHRHQRLLPGIALIAIALAFVLAFGPQLTSLAVASAAVSTTSISAPASGAEYRPGDSFSVSALIGCLNAKCNTVKSVISVPPGLVLKTAATKSWSSILPGGSKAASWLVQANKTGTYTITVITTSKNAQTSSSSIQVIIYVPACNSNIECGTSAYLSGPYCGMDGNVYRTYQSFSCLYPGTRLAQCQVSTTEVLTSSCGQSSSVGAPFCLGSSIYQAYRTVGCSSGMCTNSTTNTLIETCPNGCANGTCSSTPQPPITTAVSYPAAPSDGLTNSCGDPDGGFNLYALGNVPTPGGTGTDSCLTAISYMRIVSHTADGKTLSGGPQLTVCPNQELGLSSYATIGNCTISGSGSGSSCTGSNCFVTEGYCKDSGASVFNIFRCPAGCNNGVCLPADSWPEQPPVPTPPVCMDTDGGKNFATKGNVSAGTYSMADTCIKITKFDQVLSADAYGRVTSSTPISSCPISQFSDGQFFSPGQCGISGYTYTTGLSCTAGDPSCGLRESYCDSRFGPGYVFHLCPNGCTAGSCS